MNKRQKHVLVNFATVIVITTVAVVGMIELKNQVNRSEAMRAMKHLGRIVGEYKQKNGSIPPKSYVDSIKMTLESQARLGTLHYRAQWIQFDSPPDEILAYVIKKYHSLFFRSGAIVLRLDGRVEWMDKGIFEMLPARQRSVVKSEMAPE